MSKRRANKKSDPIALASDDSPFGGTVGAGDGGGSDSGGGTGNGSGGGDDGGFGD